MKQVLNLSEPSRNGIKFSESVFPDGQHQIDITIDHFDRKYVLIETRLNNFLDLERLICAVASLRELGVKKIGLSISYFLGSRSDRKFKHGSNNYLKSVICPIINGLNLSFVKVLDPHSDVLEACLNNFEKVSNEKLIVEALKTISVNDTPYIKPIDGCVFIAPDSGATKKLNNLSFSFNHMMYCSKYRDENGKLSKTHVDYNHNYINKDLIMVDDICDGGATFINIAKVLRERYYHRGRIILIVTHGIFSKGFNELDKYFDHIYTTNSYNGNLNREKVTVFDAFDLLNN